MYPSRDDGNVDIRRAGLSPLRILWIGMAGAGLWVALTPPRGDGALSGLGIALGIGLWIGALIVLTLDFILRRSPWKSTAYWIAQTLFTLLITGYLYRYFE